ncbi:hypothetical protein ACTWPT_57260 [Nonomuraea sp. 3N208]|uniref:hypothetical protein n=1 Tax=Nonomuraea sp. 3N208 TaxID=3457421 RepID=UPI003FD6382B
MKTPARDTGDCRDQHQPGHPPPPERGRRVSPSRPPGSSGRPHTPLPGCTGRLAAPLPSSPGHPADPLVGGSRSGRTGLGSSCRPLPSCRRPAWRGRGRWAYAVLPIIATRAHTTGTAVTPTSVTGTALSDTARTDIAGTDALGRGYVLHAAV